MELKIYFDVWGHEKTAKDFYFTASPIIPKPPETIRYCVVVNIEPAKPGVTIEADAEEEK